MTLQRYLTVDTDGVVYDWSEFKAAYQYCLILSDSKQFSTFIDTKKHFMIGDIDSLIAYKENIEI